MPWGLIPERREDLPEKNKKGKTIKGRWKQCCPEPGCSYLGTYLPEHLQNKHHLKPSSATYRTSLKIARRFKSLADELEKMVEPEPPISKISVPSPPPLPSKRAMSSDDDSDVAPSKPKKKTSKTLESDEDNSAIPSTPAKSTSKKAMSSSNDSDVAPSKPKEKKSKTLDSDSDDSENVIPPMPAKSPGSRIFIAKAPSAGSSTPTAPYEQSADLEDDCDEPDYAMKEDYFKETEPNSNRHKWLIAYYKYLFTPSAGFHKERNRLQHASQVKTILEETDPKGDDIVFLAEEEGNRVWVDWVVPNLKKKGAGTLKSYLTSLQMFLEYATKKGKRPNLPSLSDEDRNTLSDLAGSLKGWWRHITKKTSSAEWDKYLDECEHLLTNKEVHDIMNSEAAVEGRKALIAAETAECVDDLTIAQYCAARDMLNATLTRSCAARPGSLESATLDMFAKAKWDEQRRKKVMLVTSHKREEDGPAPIPMDADTVFLMEVFIKKLRPAVSDNDSPNGKIFF